MNCHENKNKQETHKHNPMKHMFHMILCCGLPIIIIGFMPIISKFNPNIGNLLSRLVPFICPIMMILMLLMMFGNNKKGSCCDNTKENVD